MAIGEKFVTKAQLEQWMRLLEHRLYELKVGANMESGSAGLFISLSDTPNSYSDQADRPVKCKASEDGLEFGGWIRQDIEESNAGSPPTASELDTLFSNPASGFTALLKDTDGPLYWVVKEGSNWHYCTFTQAGILPRQLPAAVCDGGSVVVDDGEIVYALNP